MERTATPSILEVTFFDQILAFVLAFVLFGALILINVCQMLSLVILPFSQRWFRKVNRTCADSWWSWCEWALRKIKKVEIEVTGDELPVGENAIVICNHQGMADIPVMFGVAKKAKRLGDMKWFVKDVLKFLPGVGWGMLFLDCLFVKRNWNEDASKIKRTFEKFFEYKIPMWLMIFPEGTRFKKSKHEKAKQFAKDKNLKETHHVLFPRSKGFSASVKGLDGHVKAVYDLSIGYSKNSVPGVYDLFQGRVRKIRLHVKRYPLADLPKNEDQLGSWLLDRFYEKDKWLASNAVQI